MGVSICKITKSDGQLVKKSLCLENLRIEPKNTKT